MNFLTRIAKTFGPRVLGAAASALAGWIVVKTKGVVQVDPATLVEVGTAMIAGYAATHRAASAKVNPGDAATGRVATGIDAAANDESVDTVVRIPDTH
jgi:hypothetical protein